MNIILDHVDILEAFVQDNISEINNDIKQFTYKELKKVLSDDQTRKITETEIVPYLSNKFVSYLKENTLTFNQALHDITENTIPDIKNALKEIANSEILLYKDVKSYYENNILQNIQKTTLENKVFSKTIFERLLRYNKHTSTPNSKTELLYIKNPLKKLLDKSLYIGLANGFTRDMTNINTGTKTANEGDSAQFLFLARAILAGFNCSNVDVRSSRYDAIIDYNNHLLRVQIKGISGTSIILKDRDRGGAGIDPSIPRNQGRFISSKDSDIYVAIDKQFGICYLIPTSTIDCFILKGKITVPIKSLNEYQENWNIISIVANNLFPE